MAGRNLTDVIDAIGLIQASSAWTKEDQAGLQSWFTKYLGWLMNSRLGNLEAQKINNHGTYYYLQVAAMAAFLNKTGIAKNTVEAFVQRPSVSAFIAPEKSLVLKIQPDGRSLLSYSGTAHLITVCLIYLVSSNSLLWERI